MQDDNKVLGIRDMANYLHIGINKAYELVKSTGFPAVKLSERKYVIPVAKLDEWLNDNIGKEIK